MSMKGIHPKNTSMLRKGVYEMSKQRNKRKIIRREYMEFFYKIKL